MSVFTTYNEVQEFLGPGGDGTQFAVDPTSLDLILRSGGAYPDADVYVHVVTSVPQTFTFDFTVKFDKLPTNFSDIVHKHIFLGLTDASGPCVGLFFSKIGIAYVGGVHHDGSGNLVVDSTFQVLPNSQTLVSEGEYWSFRIASDITTGATYIYITKTEDLISVGHQLRYVMPLISASSLAVTPTDETVISVRGSLGEPSQLALDSICLGTGFIIPNLPPRADAGNDQAVRTCSIVRLDGSRSFDPEEAPLTYLWRLLDAPLGSQFIFDGLDGTTLPLPMPTGFANKFHSASLGVLDGVSPIRVKNTDGFGDVLVVAGTPYTVMTKGTDGDGFYVQVDGFLLPDNLSGAPFKLLRQGSISNRTSAKPTFYPDVVGLYKFDLVVFDGSLFSEPSTTIINVTESPLPRGCVPDAHFLWNYLSDFWRLVDETDRIDVLWSAMSQVIATELLTLWQFDYNKSLRDIQRSVLRRWLHYDTLVKEPFVELTTVRGVYSSIDSTPFAPAFGTTFQLNASGHSFTVSSYLGSTVVTITGTNPIAASDIAAQIKGQLRVVDSRFDCVFVKDNAVDLGLLRITAPFPVTVTAGSTTPTFVVGTTNTPFSGTGAGVALRTYKLDRGLFGVDVQENDLLILDGVGYRISRIITDSLDVWGMQRVLLKEDLPASPATSFSIASVTTSTVLDFYGSLFTSGDTATFEVIDATTDRISFVTVPVLGTVEGGPQYLGIDATTLGQYIADSNFSVFLTSAKRRKYVPIHGLITDIPYLQESIKQMDDTAVLRKNIDFYLEEFRGVSSIRFVVGQTAATDVWELQDPPDRLWAEFNYIDNSPIIEANFGIPVEFTMDDLAQLPESVDYLSAVRGLWYTYLKGPTVFNLRAGTQILLGLPFAEEAGTIEEIRNDFTVTHGRILVRDLVDTTLVRSYSFPGALSMETNPATGEAYKVGDTVDQFAPLVTGTEVVDYVKDPEWFSGYLNQGVFFEVEKFFKFLVRVDSSAFSLSALLFARSFILQVKPTYTYPLFVVLQKSKDTEISTTDEVEFSGSLLLFDGACSQFLGGSSLGVATMLDDPRAAGGGWRNQLDQGFDPTVITPYPNGQPVYWGIDKNYLCPEDDIYGAASMTQGAPFTPTLDSIFALDSTVYTDTYAVFSAADIVIVPGVVGRKMYPDPVTISSPTTVSSILLKIMGIVTPDATDFLLTVYVNGSPLTTQAFTVTSDYFEQEFTILASVLNPGDVVTAEIFSDPTYVPSSPFWTEALVVLGADTSWSLDTPLAAGTYSVYKNM